jgi:hypothetical protein
MKSHVSMTVSFGQNVEEIRLGMSQTLEEGVSTRVNESRERYEGSCKPGSVGVH